jgi:hypothetical protein
MNALKNILTVVFTISLIGCNSDKKENENKSQTLFTKLESEVTGINFVNAIENQKDINIFKYRNFYNGGGVAMGDINNDGLTDIFLTANLSKNKLFLNTGDFKFKDITSSAQVGGTNVWSTGVVMVDINADGWLDIYVCNAGNVDGDNLKNELYINNKDLTFTEQADAYNLADNGLTTHAAFFDYDKDGDLDAYILNNSFIPVNSLNYSNKRELRDQDWDVPELLKGGGDKLLRNDNGKFIDVSEEAGIYGSLIGFGLGVTVGDVNNDNYPDIYISNDFYERDYLYINNKNGTFTESIKDWTNHISQSSMGADMSDINNDGFPDIFVTDMLPENDKRLKETTAFENFDLYDRKKKLDFYNQYMQNTLQLNLGNKSFADVAHFSGISKTDWSWGALLFDMNNDGYKDIFVCNGIYNDLTNQDFMNFFANDIIQNMVVDGKKEEVQDVVSKMPSTPVSNYAFKNNGDLNFTNSTKEWGFDTPSFSNGAAYADLDNDGDLDFVINNVNQDVFVYKNNTNEQTNNNYIKVKLEGSNLNTFGVGSVIKIYSQNEIILQEVIPSRGFQSSTDYIQTIGLGSKTIDSLIVMWPDDSHQTITSPKTNSVLALKQTNAIKQYLNKSSIKNTLFTEKPSNFDIHIENNHIDFNYEGLIQKMLSKEGPTIAIADINNDAMEDIFIGGAKDQEAQIYIQTSSGSFNKITQLAFQKDFAFEDTASSFFDVDNDGDLDLMVGTGGNEIEFKQQYNTRIYLNNGKGQFVKSQTKIPSTFNNTSVIAPFDFDNDGDMDVFIGSRSVPAVYGINPTHQLIENDGKGNFKDITESKAYNFKDLGLVTSAQWTDIDQDGKADLIIVGDWMAPTIFKNSGKRLTPISTGLDDLKGWWNAIKVVDVNNDGKLDIILGNRGNNTPYKVEKGKPIKMYVNDFDDNGTIEQIMTQTIEGKDVPMILKNELTSQLSSLKKQNLKYSDYATRSIDQLFPESILSQSIVREVNEANSLVAINNGDLTFNYIVLPKEVQFSSVNAICVKDINNDSNLDLILGGNDYNFKPQYSRLDANYGSLLLGDGTGNFKWVNYNESGFFVKGEIKSITPIILNNQQNILIGVNNEQPKLFKINNE